MKDSRVADAWSGKYTNEREMKNADLTMFVLLFKVNLECIKRAQQVQQGFNENLFFHLQKNK